MGRGDPPVRRAHRVVAEHAEHERAGLALVLQRGGGGLDRHRASELARRRERRRPRRPRRGRRGTATPAARSSAFASASESHGPAPPPRPAAAAAIARSRSGSPAGRPQRRGARERGAQARDRRHAAIQERAGGVVLQQLGQRRGDEHGRGGARGAVGEPLAHRVPARAQPRLHAGRLVVEEQQLVDGGVVGDDAHDRARAARARPRSSPCSRAGCRRSRRRGAAARAARRSRRPVARAGARSRPASSAASPESPPEQVRIASPPAGCAERARRRGTASAFASSSRSWTSSAHAAPASSTSARKTRWSPASAPVWAAAALAPAAVAPTFRTATPTSALGGPRERGGEARAVAVGLQEQRDRADVVLLDERVEQRAASSTAWLPTEATVWNRSPRPSASALTATFPLWEISATRPAARGDERVAPQRGAAVERDEPVAVRPDHRQGEPPRRPPRARPAARRRPPPRSPPRTRPARRSRGARPPGRPRARPPRGSRRRPRRPARAGRRASARTAARAPRAASGCTPQTGPAKPSAARLRSVASP